jgi:hypothetical protein
MKNRGIGMKGHRGTKSARSMTPPMGGKPAAGPSPARSAGASQSVPLSAPKSIKQFGHPAPDLKSLSTDRGMFKVKG